MAGSQEGWIRLHRQLRAHWLWPSDRPYSEVEAWVDLILSANHKIGKVSIGATLYTVQRGQHMTSQVKIARKWQWRRERVSAFLRKLKADEMIDIQTSKETSTGFTLITICNYGRYQDDQTDRSSIQSSIQPGIDFLKTPQNSSIETGIVTDIDNRDEMSALSRKYENVFNAHPASNPASEAASSQHPTDTNKNDKNEKNIKNSADRNSRMLAGDGFATFWEAYPNKKSKGQAERVWKKLNPSDDFLKTILHAIEVEKKWRSDQALNPRLFIPPWKHPSTWLNARCWEDDLTTDPDLQSAQAPIKMLTV